jgi:hypothetical protein
MLDQALKVVVISALRPTPDFSGLPVLRGCNGREIHKLLRWLDQSGLALYLYSRLEAQEAVGLVPVEFSQALERRQDANRTRALDMLGEFDRLVRALATHSVRFCALKGFTLIPDFCPAPGLRHQTDFDFLVAPQSTEHARQALHSCGYKQEGNLQNGELTFATPLRHVPSPSDDIYALPRHREVDLRMSLQHDLHGVSIAMPGDYLDRVQNKRLQGVIFPSLPADDMFSQQVMHAFRHLLGSWVRLSWLLEIGRFIEVHRDNPDLWHSIRSRVGDNSIARNAFGLIIYLTNMLFPRPIPCRLEEWCLQPLPGRIKAWVHQFGFKAAVSDLNGGKVTLFVHREFVEDPVSWNSYLKRRIFPVGGRSSIGRVTNARPRVRIRATVSQWLRSMSRATFHLRELASLAVDAIQWKRALRSIEERRALASNASDDVAHRHGHLEDADLVAASLPAPEEGSLNEVPFVQRFSR